MRREGKDRHIALGTQMSTEAAPSAMQRLPPLSLNLSMQTMAFDTLPRLGGVYAKSYDNTLLTTSSLLTAYSSFSDGKEDSPVFWTDEQ